MVNYPNYLAGSQDDINKRLLQMILELKKAEGTDVGSLATKVTALETAVGGNNSGLVKDVTDIKAAIGADDTTAGSLKKRCKDIETAIGDDTTEGTIKGRIYALEDHQ